MAFRVCDTDVVSLEFKRDTRAALYLPHLFGHSLIVSFMTVAELDGWALVHRWGTRRRTMLEAYLQQNYAFHPYTRELCTLWADVTTQARRAGRPIACADAWIAATALALGCPLVTHNPADYAGVTSLTVISESP